ncbi:MAG: hypothetical protein WAM14_00445 [Candidatus Nitrosopolaris sp.]
MRQLFSAGGVDINDEAVSAILADSEGRFIRKPVQLYELAKRVKTLFSSLQFFDIRHLFPSTSNAQFGHRKKYSLCAFTECEHLLHFCFVVISLDI